MKLTFTHTLFLTAAMTAMTQTVAAQPAQTTTGQRPARARGAEPADAIRPFRISVPEAALVDLRQRIAAIAPLILADTLDSLTHI